LRCNSKATRVRQSNQENEMKPSCAVCGADNGNINCPVCCDDREEREEDWGDRDMAAWESDDFDTGDERSYP
jgi:hypothetical protein